MKKILSLTFLIGFALMANAQTKSVYDEEMAKKYGADDYGMKKYVLAILKTGTNTTATKTQSDSLFAGHMANIGRLVTENKLIVAGPLGKNDKTYRGIFILDAKTIDEAKALVDTDPAVKGKLLAVEFYSWYGSAALPTYLPNHDKMQKKTN